jgi:hypothetical protein
VAQLAVQLKDQLIGLVLVDLLQQLLQGRAAFLAVAVALSQV